MYRRFQRKNFLVPAKKIYLGFSSLILSACGSTTYDKQKENIQIGFKSDFIPPVANFDAPKNVDPYFKVFENISTYPYWVSALEMYDGHSVIDPTLLEYDRTLKFSFPSEKPAYLPVTIAGWAPSTDSMKSASRQIFADLETVLDVSFEEDESYGGVNNLLVAQSLQTATAGLSYFPNNHYELGSDIFISKDYSNPLILKNGLTNLDYEVLVHEIGHALGLKHPFEADRNNLSILNSNEDQTKFTAMSYNEALATFDGTFRVLDWMTLTKFYGVNSDFRSGDDIYTFDEKNGTFIVDGSGIDKIDNSGSDQDTFIDLRPGAHSYEGQKSAFITAAQQLTISHNTEIENVETGSGNDTIIGNNLPNIIKSGAGDDIIFAGEDNDIIHPGVGKDKIDLSEEVNVEDIIVCGENIKKNEYDTIYGFSQGTHGDAFDLTYLNFPTLIGLPLVDVLNVPLGYIDSCLVRIFGTGLGDIESVTGAFKTSGDLEKLKLSPEKQAILIISNSQDTGEVQNIYSVYQNSDSTEVNHLAHLAGNYLDIDNWSVENFLI